MFESHLYHNKYFTRHFYAGKESATQKAKNSKKEAEKSKDESSDKPKNKHGNKTSSKSREKSPFTIPKNSRVLVEDSEDEDLGGNGINSSSSGKKFSSKATLVTRNMFDSSELLPKSMSSLADDLEKLVLYSATKQTWARHASAWNLYREFCDCFGITFNLPIPVSYIRGFATWATTKRKLKNSTVMAYISSMNIAHSLGGVSNGNLNSDPIVKMALKRAGNIYDISGGAGKTRMPMNIYLLEILSDRVAKSEWTDLSKQVFWTACTLCFFSTCRMGELLAQNEKRFRPRYNPSVEKHKIS